MMVVGVIKERLVTLKWNQEPVAPTKPDGPSLVLTHTVAEQTQIKEKEGRRLAPRQWERCRDVTGHHRLPLETVRLI